MGGSESKKSTDEPGCFSFGTHSGSKLWVLVYSFLYPNYYSMYGRDQRVHSLNSRQTLLRAQPWAPEQNQLSWFSLLHQHWLPVSTRCTKPADLTIRSWLLPAEVQYIERKFQRIFIYGRCWVSNIDYSLVLVSGTHSHFVERKWWQLAHEDSVSKSVSVTECIRYLHSLNNWLICIQWRWS